MKESASLSTLASHLENPEIGIDEYTRLSSIALGQTLGQRTAVYLDMNFWIWMRDPDLHANPSLARELLALLRQGVSNETIFCPISQSTFIELLKQSDMNSRLSTADIVDELSLGVAIVEEEVRFSTEVAHLMHDQLGAADLHPMNHLVWTKLSYVLGLLHPSNTPFDALTELAIQKAFFDHMCTIPLREMIETLGDGETPDADLGRVAEKVNDGNREHSLEIRSFKQVYAAEIRGVFDVSLDGLPDLIVDLAERAGKTIMLPNERQRNETRAQYRELFSRALEQGKERERLRTAHIYACLHASLRWNKTQKYKSNDIYDYHHAVAALAYCDVFQTEKSLSATVQQNHLQLDKLYDCKVTAKMDEAVEVLKNLVS